MTKLVAYKRVSTKKQGNSGLGMDAQDTMIEQYRRQVNGVIVATLEEVESGSNNERPKLWAAIKLAKELGARLVVAKLDRLSRSMGLVHALMESRVDFVCCDMPTANPLTIYIFAAIGQHELTLIRDRTQKAMNELKSRGTKLGASNPKIAEALKGKRGQYDRKNRVENRRKSWTEQYDHLIPMVRELKMAGRSWSGITRVINERYIESPEDRLSEWQVRSNFGSIITLASTLVPV